jgi:hypothetical protein
MVARQEALFGARRHIRSTGDGMNPMYHRPTRMLDGRALVAAGRCKPLWSVPTQPRPIIASALKVDLVGTEQVVAMGKKRLRVFY